MNQWIDRIAEFLPGAKVGKIQGPTCDLIGKDIVLGMLQTLYDKEFPTNTFSQFGLTIVDEVHRIGSEQFSKTLLKTITPYMLGISATVERKDKLTKVLYMFMGDKIYSEKRDNADAVTVRAVEFVSRDPQFNEVVYDFRGNAQYSTMITKLCDFGPRSDFIVRMLGDLFIEHRSLDLDQGCQIMVLCHNRSLLTYLYSAIKNRLPQHTVGYYVGGMKQRDLQETEGKEIVLATYAMAAEALDIKTLSILILATPKTDIIQLVGRILRVRHDNPVVIDVVDSHELFQNQWKKRRAYYKKSNYRILITDNTKYDGMIGTLEKKDIWKSVFEPKGVSLRQENEDEPVFTNHAGTLFSEGKCMVKLD
jgi:superfamily II DNA or RNA helicase